MGLLSDYIFPIVGIGIIFFWILAFFLPYGKRFNDKIQTIEGFGVNLKVSVLTLVLLVGLALSSAGIVLNLLDYRRREVQYQEALKQSDNDRRAAEKALEAAKRTHLKLILTLEGANPTEISKLQEWEGEYQIVGEADPIRVDVGKGILPNQFSIYLADINTQTTIRSVVVRHLPSNRTWSFREMFVPLEPSYTLTPGD